MKKRPTTRFNISRKRLRQYASMLVLFVMCIVVGRGVWGMWGTFTRAQTEAAISSREVDKYRVRAAAIVEEAALYDDPRSKEIELRKRFDVGRPGEKLFVVVEETHPEIQPVVPITLYDRLHASLPMWLRW
jgi:hypothetical protein